MSQCLKAREDLEKNYSLIIKILEGEKSKIEKEKEIYIKNIDTYETKINIIKDKINDILNNNENFIEESKEHLIPEKYHEKDILKRKQDLYQEIFNYLNEEKVQISNEFDIHIKECQNKIDMFKKEEEFIRQAIWRGEIVEIKINEVTNIKDLKEYYNKNKIILEKLNI